MPEDAIGGSVRLAGVDLGPVGTWERGKIVGGAVGLRLERVASDGCWSSLRCLLAWPGRFRLRMGLEEDDGAANGGRRPLPGLLIVQAPGGPAEGVARLQLLPCVNCSELQLVPSASLTAMRAREPDAATFSHLARISRSQRTELGSDFRLLENARKHRRRHGQSRPPLVTGVIRPRRVHTCISCSRSPLRTPSRGEDPCRTCSSTW